MSELGNDLDRFQALGRVFREMPLQVAGRTLAPLTAGRWDLLRERENAFLFHEGSDPEPPPDRKHYLSDPGGEATYREDLAAWEADQQGMDSKMLFGVCEFLYVHTAPVEEVLAAHADSERWRTAVQALAFDVELAELIRFMLDFRERLESLAAGMTEPLDDDDDEEGGGDDPGKPATSPTGSPSTSTASAATSPPSAAPGSSGGSPSPRAGNTSMPPMPVTAPPAAGSGIPVPNPRPTPSYLPAPTSND